MWKRTAIYITEFQSGRVLLLIFDTNNSNTTMKKKHSEFINKRYVLQQDNVSFTYH